MSNWNEVSLTYESRSLSDADGTYGQILVEFSVAADGTYEEYHLEIDSEVSLSVNGKPLHLTDLPPDERVRLMAAVDRELDRLTDQHGDEISQSLAERAADRLHDQMEDR